MVGGDAKHTDDVYTAIMCYLWQHGDVVAFMEDILKTEISATCMFFFPSKQPPYPAVARQQLFRTDSQATKLLMSFVKKVGQNWFHSMTGMISVFALSCHVDCYPYSSPSIFFSTYRFQLTSSFACAMTASNLWKLTQINWLREIISQSTKRDSCQSPSPSWIPFCGLLRTAQSTCDFFFPTILELDYLLSRILLQLCQILYNEVIEVFPESGVRAVGGIIFLRYLCPTILSPPASIIAPGMLFTRMLTSINQN